MRKAFLSVCRPLAVLVVLAIPLVVAASSSASTAVAGGPPVGSTPALTSTTWSTVTPIAASAAGVKPAVLCANCGGNGGVTPACYTYNAYGSSYLNSGAEGINMHLWFSACHDSYGVITQVSGVGQSCDAWGFINERNAYVNQDSGGVGQTFVKFHSHCEFSPSIGPLSTFWLSHDLYATANGTD